MDYKGKDFDGDRVQQYGKKKKKNMAKIYQVLETNSSFHVKQDTTGKVQFSFFKSFLLALTKLSFWEGELALGYNSVKL